MNTTTHADCNKSLRRAIERQNKDAAGWEWDVENGRGVCQGRFNTATIEASQTGIAVNVWRADGSYILDADYKTLGAALRNGRMYSNCNYNRSL